MAEIEPASPVKLFVAMLWAEAPSRDAAIGCLGAYWGEFDFVGGDHPFDITDYYEPEMGSGLMRRLVSFAALVSPEEIRSAKRICNQIERQIAVGTRRRVNLDVGYLDRSKIVLASVKYAGQKIYLGEGVYADLVARYREGRYQPFEWTFPDFRDGRYDAELVAIRRIYLEQLRDLSRRAR